MTTTTSHSLAIAAEGLRKAYGDKTVLDGIDLAVPTGTVFSLLGPNGAGKTTAVKILSTLITADAGDLHVGGHDLAADPQAVRAAIGVTGQFSAVDGLITGEENMLLMADLHHLSRSEGRRTAAELLERFDLVEAAKKPVSTYSGGMKRRLDGIDLAVPAGTVFSLLGPNGAGKTTAVKILSTLITADAGDCASAATTWPPTRRPCAPRSASPASSPPSTA